MNWKTYKALHFDFGTGNAKAEAIFKSLYKSGSSKAKEMFDIIKARGELVYVEKNTDGNVDASFFDPSDPRNYSLIRIDYEAAADQAYISASGKVRTFSLMESLVHEFAHCVYRMDDPDDTSAYGSFNSVADYQGIAVSTTNIVLAQLGRNDRERTSYSNGFENGFFGLTQGTDLLDDRTVDLILIDHGAGKGRQKTIDTRGITQETDDFAIGSTKTNIFYSGHGDDILLSQGGSDTLYGGHGDDVLNAGKGRDDVVYGGRGDDTVFIEFKSADTIMLGRGDDEVYVRAGKNHTIDGGDGYDIVDLTQLSNADDFQFSNLTKVEEIRVSEEADYDDLGNDVQFVLHANDAVTIDVDGGAYSQDAVFGENRFGVEQGYTLDLTLNFSNLLNLSTVSNFTSLNVDGFGFASSAADLEDGWASYSSYLKSGTYSMQNTLNVGWTIVGQGGQYVLNVYVYEEVYETDIPNGLDQVTSSQTTTVDIVLDTNSDVNFTGTSLSDFTFEIV